MVREDQFPLLSSALFYRIHRSQQLMSHLYFLYFRCPADQMLREVLSLHRIQERLLPDCLRRWLVRLFDARLAPIIDHTCRNSFSIGKCSFEKGPQLPWSCTRRQSKHQSLEFRTPTILFFASHSWVLIQSHELDENLQVVVRLVLMGLN